MSIRPFREIKRAKTKVINVGEVKVGGDNPISVQSMTNTLTTDIKATINQIIEIQEEGADLVRVSYRVPDIIRPPDHTGFSHRQAGPAFGCHRQGRSASAAIPATMNISPAFWQ